MHAQNDVVTRWDNGNDVKLAEYIANLIGHETDGPAERSSHPKPDPHTGQFDLELGLSVHACILVFYVFPHNE